VLHSSLLAEVLGTATVKTGSAPVLRGKETVGTVQKGRTLTVTAIRGDWYGLHSPRGWVHRSFVRFEAKPGKLAEKERPAPEQPHDLRQFVDAGGRFSCMLPKDWAPVQKETAARSKVGIKAGRSGASITIIVRNTALDVVGQGDLDEMLNKMRQSSNLAKATVIQKGFGQIDECRSVGLTVSIRLGPKSLRSRTVKYRKHGYDHVITLGTMSSAPGSVEPTFEEFLRSYRSIDPAKRSSVSKERELPPGVDFKLD